MWISLIRYVVRFLWNIENTWLRNATYKLTPIDWFRDSVETLYPKQIWPCTHNFHITFQTWQGGKQPQKNQFKMMKTNEKRKLFLKNNWFTFVFWLKIWKWTFAQLENSIGANLNYRQVKCLIGNLTTKQV
jgi:hypothetical protein